MLKWLRNRENGTKRRINENDFKLDFGYSHYHLLDTQIDEDDIVQRMISYTPDDRFLVAAWSNVSTQDSLIVWDTGCFNKNEISVDFGICNVQAIDINEYKDEIIVAGTKYQPHLARVTGKLTSLSLEGKVQEEQNSETAIHDAKFIDYNSFAIALGQNWSVSAGLTDESSISVYDLRSPRPTIQFEADSYQEFRTLSCKEIDGRVFIAGAGDQIVSIYDLRMPNREYIDLSVTEGFYNGGTFKVESIKWNPSGSIITTAGENHVRFFDFKNNGVQNIEIENRNDSSDVFNEIEWIDNSKIILGHQNVIVDIIEVNSSSSFSKYTQKRLQSYKTYGYNDQFNQFQIRFNKKHNQIATAFNDKIGIWSHFEMPKREFSASYKTKHKDTDDYSIIGQSQGVSVPMFKEKTTVPRKGLIPPFQISEHS